MKMAERYGFHRLGVHITHPARRGKTGISNLWNFPAKPFQSLGKERFFVENNGTGTSENRRLVVLP
jgi:hypothetical protein